MFRVLSGVVVGVILMLTIMFGLKLSGLSFNYDIESFFSKTDPELSYYYDYRETFENDNDFVLIGILNEEGIFVEDFLKDVQSLTADLKALDLITRITSPTNVEKSIVGPMGGVLQVPLVHVDDPSRYQGDKQRIYSANDVYSSMFSRDTANLTILLKKEEFTSRPANDSLLTAITNAIEKYSFDDYHIGGRIKTQNYYIGKMASEMPLFAGGTFILLILFLLFTFRCGLGVLIPILVLIVSLVWTLAAIHFSGNKIDLMLTMMPALLFIIGISNSIHLITKYIDEVGAGKNDLRAVRTTLIETGFTVFLTSSTTALGFFSLMIIDIEPIQRFGMFTGIGVMITFLISITLVPSLLLNIKSENISCSYQLKVGWDNFMKSVYGFSRNHSRLIVVISIVLVAISLSGIHGIKINNHFLDDIAQESPLKKDLLYFENNFSGIRPFEMGIDLVDSNNSIFQRDVLIEMEIVERYLQDEYGVGALVSPLTIVKSANRAIHGGRNRFYTLPDSEKGLAEVMKLLKKNKKLREYKMLVNENRARISGKMKDLGSLEVAERNLSLATYLAENTALATFHITGAAQLMDNSNANIALNLTRGLGIALAFTAVILGLLFSSLRIALLSLIPNAFPLILIGGMMGWFGVDLKVATALIFPIAFGIAVDDTIHLLSRLRIELEYGASWEEAIRNSILKTGKAILITTLILSSGFGVFMFSEFQSTYYIGLLVGMALIFAVLADLFLLPILLGTKK